MAALTAGVLMGIPVGLAISFVMLWAMDRIEDRRRG